MSKAIIHNLETGEIIERDMTSEEIAAQEASIRSAKERAEAEKQLEEAKKNALQKLALLGFSEEEIKALGF